MSVSVLSAGSTAENDNDSESESELVLADADCEIYSDDGEAEDQEESGSEPDEEKRRLALEQIRSIAEEFELLKDRLYQEKVAQLDVELKQIEEKTHPDYVGRIAALNVEMAQRIEVIGLYARLELQSLDVATHFDKLLAERTLQDKKRELRTSLMSNLLRRKQRLEALQKQSEQIEAELTDTRLRTATKSTKAVKRAAVEPPPRLEKRKIKAQLVEWPFVIYQLRDQEIQEDLAAIKRAVKGNRRPQQKMSDRDIDVYFEDGKLFYDRRWYERGQHIHVDNRDHHNYWGAITAINTGEVWIKRADGGKTKLYVSQLRLGKYTIRPKRD